MAKLSAQEFIIKYIARFANNTTGQIDEADLRDFARDIADSFGGSLDYEQLNLEWNSETSYNTTDNQYSEAFGRLYKSKQDGNIGHQPPSAPNVDGDYEDDWWEEISKAASSLFVEWEPKAYGSGLVIVFYDNTFRKLNVQQRPFLSQDIEAETDEEKWTVIGGAALGNKVDKIVSEAFSAELTFDKDKYCEIDLGSESNNINILKAIEGNVPFKTIVHYVRRTSGSILYNIPTTFHNPTLVEIDYNRVNVVWYLYHANGDVERTITHLGITTGLTQLATPTDVQATSGGADTINVTWTAVTNASSYNVYESLTGDLGSFSLVANPTTNSWQRTGLTEGVTRYYYVIAVGDSITYSDSGASSTVNATTSSSVQVATPVQNDIVPIDSITNRISWSNVSGESSFDVYRRNTGATEWGTVIANVAANTLTYDDATCTPEQSYDYSIIAKGDGGSVLDSSRSNIKTVITNGVLTPLISLTPGDGQITINITNIDPHRDSISLIRDTNSDFSTAVAVEEYVSPNNSVVDLLLTNGQKYHYKITSSVNGVNSVAATANTFPYSLENDYSVLLDNADGFNDSIYISDNNIILPRSMSVLFWLKTSLADGTASTIFSIIDAINGNTQFDFGIEAVSNGYFIKKVSDTSNFYRAIGGSKSLNEWTLVGLTFNASSVKVYINKLLITMTENVSLGTFSGYQNIASGRLRILRPPNGSHIINQHMVFDKELSGTEITQFNLTNAMFVPSGLLSNVIQWHGFEQNPLATYGTDAVLTGSPTYVLDTP